MLTEEQLQEIEAEQHRAIIGRWVPQLLSMVRGLQHQLRQCAGELGAAEDSLVQQRQMVQVQRARIKELEVMFTATGYRPDKEPHNG